MGKIYCLMGKSSTGKDTLYQRILKSGEIEIHKLIPYTTRPIRRGETEGVEYHFTDETELNSLEEQGKIIELRAYDTVYGIWKYFTVDDEQLDLDKNTYLIIGTLESYLKIRSYFGTSKVEPLYVEVEDGIRLQRALDREKLQELPKYEEMCRRFLADAKDFSEENLMQAGITNRFINLNLEETTEEILSYIRNTRENR